MSIVLITVGDDRCQRVTRGLSLFVVTISLLTLFVAKASSAPQSQEVAQQTKPLTADQFKALQQKAEQGNAAAQVDLGCMYLGVQGVPQDLAQALAWFRKAADQGDAQAQYKVGSMYSAGLGVPRDYAQALTWFRRAADQGDAQAQSEVAFMYFVGEGVPKDYAQAAAWFRKAAVSVFAR